MLVPLVILAVLAVAGGWWAAPQLFGGADYFARFLDPIFAVSGASAPEAASLLNWLLGPPVIAGLVGFLVAYWFYIKQPGLPERLTESARGIYRLLMGKYFVDELYAAVIVRPLLWISTNVLWHAIDEQGIDGAVNGISRETGDVGDRLRHLNSGNTRSYATWVVVGAVALTTVLIWAVR